MNQHHYKKLIVAIIFIFITTACFGSGISKATNPIKQGNGKNNVFSGKDFSLNLIRYNEKPSDEPGYKLIEIQVALQNNTKDSWLILDQFSSWPGKLISDDGVVYEPIDHRKTCTYVYKDHAYELVCSEGSFGGGHLTTSLDIIPPGFQALFRQEEWKVGEAINNFTYNLEVDISKNYTPRETFGFSLDLEKTPLTPFLTQFVNNMSWEDYKKWGVKNALLLDAGDSHSFDFGEISFSDQFEVEDVLTAYLLNYEIKVRNASNAYELILESPEKTSCTVGSSFIYGCSINSNPEYFHVNPGQEMSFFIDRYVNSSDVKEFLLPDGVISYPICFFAPNINWEINNEKFTEEVNLIICDS